MPAERPALDGKARPRLTRGVRMRFDGTRQCWVVLAPERVLMPDEIAVEILQRCDGERSLDAIIADLAANFDAEPQTIAADVRTMLSELIDKRILTL